MLPDNLSNSKKWLTVPEAAHFLSNKTNKKITEPDVLSLGLHKKLKLSVRFINPVNGRLVKFGPLDDIQYRDMPLAALYRKKEITPDDGAEVMAFHFDNLGTFYLSDVPEFLKEVWDLPMIGNEKIRVEDEYQQLTTRHAAMFDLDMPCVLVESPDGQKMYELQEFLEPTPCTLHEKGMTEGDYHPAQCLPEDSVMGVRMSALTELMEHYSFDEFPDNDSTAKTYNAPPVPQSMQEKFPGDPGEPPLVGWRKIAPFLGLKVGENGKKTGALKRLCKMENFPLMRTPNKKPYTYESQIKKFLASYS